jgi:hypothetical protein
MKTQNPLLHFLADFQLSQPTAKGERTFSGIAYAGGVITDHSWFKAVAFDLTTTQAETPLPLLFNHGGSPIGVIETVSIGTQIEIAGRLFADIDPVAKDIAAKADRGIVWQLSVGIFPAETANLNSTQNHTINGQSFTGEITLLKQNRIREVSFVTMGADDKTQVTVFNTTQKPQETTMTPEEIKALQDENARLKNENSQFKADAEAAQKVVRETEIKNLFAAIGRDYSEATAAPYFSFNAEQFKAVSADLLTQKETQKTNLPAHLFGTQATDGVEQQPTAAVIDTTAIYHQMNARGSK